jgi:hypothetical protein
MASYSEPTQGSTRSGEAWPHWIVELDRSLAIRPQFVLSGNIRDVYLTPTPDGLVFQPIIPCVWEALSRRGFEFLLAYDRVDGICVYPATARVTASRLSGVSLSENGGTQVSLDKLSDWLRAVAGAREVPCAFIIDYASRLVGRPQDLTDIERDFFTACEKLAHTAKPLRVPGRAGPPPYNPVIWLISRPNDLPDWFIVGNEAIRTLVVGLPDRMTRWEAATRLARGFTDYGRLTVEERHKLLELFAELTDSLTLRSMLAISELARDQTIPLAQIADAVRCYKVGVPDNPWKQEYLKTKIHSGETAIGVYVKGQAQAVSKALDILTRSVMGLSGAHASARGGRPRGVLFFAGPTGVGKTELAKAITRLIFGDEQAYIRFDMSEFSAEHADARLIGAPPGYVGYDTGGELVNAIRQRPFSVVLFDEIEKAHPRILDKFLQILEDGRLTDGRGDTVFFSEAVIIFTSNLGVYVEDETGQRVLNVSPEDPFAQVEQKIRGAIEHHFRFQLQRPELLNRMGDNIVVFDFIRQPVAKEIFEKMVQNVVERVRDEHGVTIELPEAVRDVLLKECMADLAHGGRGIGNRIETAFINPLARTLFETPLAQRHTWTVQRIIAKDGIYKLELT